MLLLETKQSGGKLLPHSDLQGESVSREGIAQQEKGHFFRDMECLEPIQSRLTYGSGQGISQIQIKFSGFAGG